MRCQGAGTGSWYKGLVQKLVQLGGLEPPTSCSTDRRSNQLSYNCIRHGVSRERAETMGNASLWQAASVDGSASKFASKRPGTAGPDRRTKNLDQFCDSTERETDLETENQATFGKIFDDAVRIGSIVSEVTFWPSSASSLAWVVAASYWLRA